MVMHFLHASDPQRRQREHDEHFLRAKQQSLQRQESRIQSPGCPPRQAGSNGVAARTTIAASIPT